MGEAYFNLKLKLEELGYNNTLPLDAVPLVECILADLLQTTRSLQHYMDLSKVALQQRDSLLMEAEPYRCENSKLIQENNKLHRELIELKEEYDRLVRESKRKIKSLSNELTRKDGVITKLQHDLRDLSMRGLCAQTYSSRSRSRRKDAGDHVAPKSCACNGLSSHEKDNTELSATIQLLEQQNEAYCDEIMLLKNQIEHRDNEILRLNMLLEGGRPIAAMVKDCCKRNSDSKVQDLTKQLLDSENANDMLKKELDSCLQKQHEAMLRALNLAEQNKKLEEELQKVDTLALKVEEDCNKRLGLMINEINALQSKLENLTLKNSQLEKFVSKPPDSSLEKNIQDKLNIAMKEKEDFLKEIERLREEIKHLSETNVKLQNIVSSEIINKTTDKHTLTSKDELQCLLEEQGKKYVTEIHDKLNETMTILDKHLAKCKENPKGNKVHESVFLKDLHQKLCDTEQKLLMLKKENDELKNKISSQEQGNRENYRDIISQLNTENTELSKENIMLSQQLSQYKNARVHYDDRGDYCKKDIQKLKDEIESLIHEIKILKKDNQEYNLRYKEAMDHTDKLKRDLAFKQKEIEKLQEENCSYKMSSRTGKASADHLKDERNFLREQIKRMQTDIIKEKTLASQIKSLQLETERSSNEIQNELLSTQKRLNMYKDTIESLEKKCNNLQSEIMSLKTEKSNLIENIRIVDQERDKLVIELDHKAETISALEQKLKSQTYDISRLENELSELQRKLNINKVSEHKLIDSESQITFLNGEIIRLTQKLDAAVMENKHLQNSLADVNGTLKITKIEYDKSRKEVEGLKQQLQHYVAEIRRIEELLSEKEAERSDMLEHFASLSVEANILENTNHSLESESASKSMQLQSYIGKIESLESKLLDKENIIESQCTKIATMTCKITSLENEIKLINEEKAVLEQNVLHLKHMCNDLQSNQLKLSTGMCDTETEMKLYENKIRSLANTKTKLSEEKDRLEEKLTTTEKLLSNARKEIVELKLALQDATSETKSLHERVNRLSKKEESEIHETMLTREELQLPLMLEETIHEVSHEEDDDSSRYFEVHKRLSKYAHSSTL